MFVSNLAGIVVIPAKAGIQVLNGSRALRAISKATCGWLTHGRLLWTRTIPGPRPSGRLRLSKFDPVEFVFACAKTILPGAKLGAHSAPAGPAPGMARAKSNQKKHTPEPPTPSCASRPNRRSPQLAGRELRASGSNTRLATPPIRSAMLGGGYGDLSNPPQVGTRRFFQYPVLRTTL
jgi:hypothetical protein